jgi:catechol 2,3-dioxygenase-like lactoylglutathione lyase family enzyme/ketosteroid isomerase-like protein
VIRAFDHVTVVVRDVAAAVHFFALLGFREERAVVISGDPFDRYMRVPGIASDHVTLVHASVTPRLEVQLLRYQEPPPDPGACIPGPTALGYNHVCFAVDDVDGEVRRLVAAGVALQNEPMVFHDRKLVFLNGPEGITVELAEWQDARVATLRDAYDAFNRRDVERVLVLLTDDVAWPDMLEGRVLHGVAAVRAYWQRQLESISSHVEPRTFRTHGDRVLAIVEQRVQRLAGGPVETAIIAHLYTFRDDRIARMEVIADLDAAGAALRDASGAP